MGNLGILLQLRPVKLQKQQTQMGLISPRMVIILQLAPGLWMYISSCICILDSNIVCSIGVGKTRNGKRHGKIRGCAFSHPFAKEKAELYFVSRLK
ncbi:hypothetical protein D3C76_1604800 [compost metagenome]